MSEIKRGLFIGRFQPFHMGHYKSLFEASGKVDELVVAIGSADKSHTRDNPFTAGERYSMITKSLRWDKIDDKIIIIPIPDLGRYGLWVNHIETFLPPIQLFLSSDQHALYLFTERGYDTEVLEIHDRDKFRGSKIRNLIASGKKLGKLIPTGTRHVLDDIHGYERIQSIYGGD